MSASEGRWFKDLPAAGRQYFWQSVIGGLIAVTGLNTWFATKIALLDGYGWGVYPVIGIVLTLIIAAALALLSGAAYIAAIAKEQWFGKSEPQTVPSDAIEGKIAKVSINHDRPSEITKPSKVWARIEFERHAPSADIYIRWARFVGYLNAPNAWKWSRQRPIIEAKNCHPGRRFDVDIAEVPVDQSQFKILDDDFSVPDSRYPKNVCVEVIVASQGVTETKREILAFVKSTKGIACLFQPPDTFDGTVDE